MRRVTCSLVLLATGVVAACGDRSAPSAPTQEQEPASTFSLSRLARVRQTDEVAGAVMFRRRAGGPRGATDAEVEALERAGAYVTYRFRNIPALLVHVRQDAMTRIRQRTGVRLARESRDVATVTVSDRRGWHWYFTGMRFPGPPQTYNGDRVDVAILDTGIDCAHDDFGYSLYGGRCGHLLNWHPDAGHPGEDDCCFDPLTGQQTSTGHGTSVAGIVAASLNNADAIGPAYQATVHSMRVCNRYASCNFDAAAGAIDHVIEQGWSLANMSFGGDSIACAEPEEPCIFLEASLRAAYGAGVTVVASSGNDTSHYNVPAAYPQVTAVSGVRCLSYFAGACRHTSFVRIWENSPRAGYHDLAAAADNVTAPRPGPFGGGVLAFEGTSAAAPIVTAAVAVALHKFPGCRQPAAIRSHLRNTTWQTVDHDSLRLGAGVLSAVAFLQENACDVNPGGPPPLEWSRASDY